MTSANRWIGALEPCASSTIFTIDARAVSFPTFVASISIEPFLLIVEPMTVASTSFSIGMDSPVIIDSSTEVLPFTTIPSTGIFSPGFTTKRSPTITSSTGIIISSLSLITRASFACKLSNEDNAFVV